MNSSGCFDTMELLINGMRHKDGLRENTYKKENIEIACKHIDEFISIFDGYGYEINIDNDINNIEVSVIFEEFQIDDFSDSFYDIVRISKEMSLQFIDYEHLKINFIFGGIWEE